MEPGKMVFSGLIGKGRQVTLRYPVMSDVEAMRNYINTLSLERTHIRFQGEKISLEDEEQYLAQQLKGFSQGQTVLLLLFCDERLIGIAGIEMSDKTERHVGILGISLLKDFRKEGIGSFLMEQLLKEAIENIPLLEIATLVLFSNNTAGFNLYKKFGFVEYGRLSRGIKLENQYVDSILMCKILRR